ncbi:MAG TPA: PEP-CTERM sorting domain-containing protein [Methylomirabilota bacterium]|nr:PEP-CTERM sorting domain-containing protein [Methylomirabilota bacterium]
MHCMKRVVLAAAFVAMLAPPPAVAASLGIDITGEGIAGQNPVAFTIGWGVDVIAPVRVTALGIWDEGSNGLLVSHAVGLWTGAGTLLASTTIPAGSAADIAVPSVQGDGRWLFEDIADLILPVGHYVLGSTSAGDDFRANQDGVILDPSLANFDPAQFAVGAALQFPDQDAQAQLGLSLFGPNLLLEQVTAPAPLPASLALIGLGLLGLGARRAVRRSAR